MKGLISVLILIPVAIIVIAFWAIIAVGAAVGIAAVFRALWERIAVHLPDRIPSAWLSPRDLAFMQQAARDRETADGHDDEGEL